MNKLSTKIYEVDIDCEWNAGNIVDVNLWAWRLARPELHYYHLQG